MSYDITLNDRITGETILFEEKHYMTGFGMEIEFKLKM